MSLLCDHVSPLDHTQLKTLQKVVKSNIFVNVLLCQTTTINRLFTADWMGARQASGGLTCVLTHTSNDIHKDACPRLGQFTIFARLNIPESAGWAPCKRMRSPEQSTPTAPPTHPYRHPPHTHKLSQTFTDIHRHFHTSTDTAPPSLPPFSLEHGLIRATRGHPGAAKVTA